MKILAIETSCDETGIALIEAKNEKIKVLANLVSSQIETHRPFGGVVPHLAKREHQKALPMLWQKLTSLLDHRDHIITKRSYDNDMIDKFNFRVDLIAVTYGPGLSPCLWAGINFAQELAQKFNKPLVGINHLKGHIYAALLETQNSKFKIRNSKQIPNSKSKISNGLKSKFPVLSLIVSGGHTQLVYSKKIGHYQIIGETRDDAAGEAFDKVARLLNLGYPGGPEISKLAEKGDPKKFDFPRPMINSKNYDFSFSGLKTAVLYLVKGLYPKGKPLKLIQKNIADVCASFEQAAVDVLIYKTLLAAKNLKPKTLILGGGVAANKKLRRELKRNVTSQLNPSINSGQAIKLILPPIALTGDNALMIALAAWAELTTCDVVTVRNDIASPDIKNTMNLTALPNLRLDKI